MNRTLRLRHLALTLTVLGIAFTSLAAPATAPAPAPRSAASFGCPAAEYHQMDFWLGDWDTLDSDTPGGSSVARARIEPIAQGCAIHELYEQTDGLVGESITSYDPVRKQWQQTWVTNRGSLLVVWGNLTDGAMVLEGDAHVRDGTTVRQRVTWKSVAAGVQESAVLSKDGGKTWVPAFDVVFVRRGTLRK